MGYVRMLSWTPLPPCRPAGVRSCTIPHSDFSHKRAACAHCWCTLQVCISIIAFGVSRTGVIAVMDERRGAVGARVLTGTESGLSVVKHRICKKCGGRIKKVHRWHVVHHRFLFLRWETVEHRDCARPEMDPTAVRITNTGTESLFLNPDLFTVPPASVGRLVPRMPENEDGVQQTYVEGL